MGTFFSKDDDMHILTRMHIAVPRSIDHRSRDDANIVIKDLKKLKYKLSSKYLDFFWNKREVKSDIYKFQHILHHYHQYRLYSFQDENYAQLNNELFQKLMECVYPIETSAIKSFYWFPYNKYILKLKYFPSSLCPNKKIIIKRSCLIKIKFILAILPAIRSQIINPICAKYLFWFLDPICDFLHPKSLARYLYRMYKKLYILYQGVYENLLFL